MVTARKINLANTTAVWAALRHLQYAADHGNVCAKQFLEHRHEQSALHAAETVLRMLRSMANIFREQAASARIYRGMQIDRKLRREQQEKRLAEGIHWEMDEYPRFSIAAEDEARAKTQYYKEWGEQDGEAQSER